MSILVSICCITYNHEKYIREALDSFLMQKTNFEYEILVHDDASTDNTAKIIREYESKYPNLIKPIYQTKNQYSQGVAINASYVWPRAQGKYIALCEGDDYWTDPYKLQKQIDVLEDDATLSLCIHATRVMQADGKSTVSIIRPNTGNIRFQCEDMILGGSFFHTSSVVYPKRFTENLPSWFFEAPEGHTALPLILAIYGDVYYIDEVMSVYRRDVPGGWTMTVFGNSEKSKLYYEALIKKLENFDTYTNNKYSEAVNKKIAKYKLKIPKREVLQFALEIIQTKPIVIFGTGSGGLKIFNEIKNLNIKDFKYFVDNDEQKEGLIFCDKQIYNPKILDKSDNIFIVVASSYYDEIRGQLINMGFKENVDFVDGITYLYNVSALDKERHEKG